MPRRRQVRETVAAAGDDGGYGGNYGDAIAVGVDGGAAAFPISCLHYEGEIGRRRTPTYFSDQLPHKHTTSVTNLCLITKSDAKPLLM